MDSITAVYCRDSHGAFKMKICRNQYQELFTKGHKSESMCHFLVKLLYFILFG